MKINSFSTQVGFLYSELCCETFLQHTYLLLDSVLRHLFCFLRLIVITATIVSSVQQSHQTCTGLTRRLRKCTHKRLVSEAHRQRHAGLGCVTR